MLVLNRRQGQRIFILTPNGQEVQLMIEVREVDSRIARLAFEAPGLTILREELMPEEMLSRYYQGLSR